MDLVENPIHSRDQRDGNETYDAAHDDNDGGLEETRETLDDVFQFAAVVVRGGAQLLSERACVFADSHHLAGGSGKEAGRRKRSSEALAPQHRFTRSLE